MSEVKTSTRSTSIEKSTPSNSNSHEKCQDEIFNYICKYDGPDFDRRAHPRKLKVDLSDLLPALEAAQEAGYCRGIKPYHFQIVRGLWKDPQWVDEILLKQVSAILQERYGGNFLKFVQGVQAKDLLEPLQDTVGRWTYNISVAQPLGTIYRSSPYDISMRYLELTGQHEKYRGLLPIHFSTAAQGTFSESKMALEVVTRKIKSLLRTDYHYDFARLCAQVTREEIMAPFIDRVRGENLLVRVGGAASHYNQCVFTMLKAYIDSQGLTKRFQSFKPYHLSTSAQGTYNNQTYVREVVVKACLACIKNVYMGDETAFLRWATLPQIEQPFVERIDGRLFRVCSRSAIQKFGESSVRIKELYRRWKRADHI